MAVEVETLQRAIIFQHGDRIETKSGDMRLHCLSIEIDHKRFQRLVAPKKREGLAPRGVFRVAQ
jgi:hypothetical protein